ncbi:uncharacterized protein [Triticum aestivum]|uniref:uncharacterized protein n=1 Tax=Triticum aestivum TaxID=4565 RepID=UPI001D02990E|nr:uncharacterized protein LOC123083435 [Triticum aestivum]
MVLHGHNHHGRNLDSRPHDGGRKSKRGASRLATVVWIPASVRVVMAWWRKKVVFLVCRVLRLHPRPRPQDREMHLEGGTGATSRSSVKLIHSSVSMFNQKKRDILVSIGWEVSSISLSRTS